MDAQFNDTGARRRDLLWDGHPVMAPLNPFLARACAALVQRWRRYRLRRQGVDLGHGVIIEGPVDISGGSRITIGPRVRLGPHIVLHTAGQGHIMIGADTYIGRFSTVVSYIGIDLGSDCLIAPFAYIIDVNHGTNPGRLLRLQRYRGDRIRIGSDVWLGAQCVVLPGVNIEDGAIVGANSVVTRNIRANSVVAGSPVSLIRRRSRGA